MKENKDNLEKTKQAVKTVVGWAGAGQKAFNLVQKIESAKLHDEPIELTEQEKQTLFRGAIKMMLKGIMSSAAKKELQKYKLDPNNLIKSVVEPTMVKWFLNQMAEGNIENLIALEDMIKDKEDNISANAKKITRERVVIEIGD